MARIEQPPPGRLICSIAYSHIDALADSLTRMEHQFGPVQFETIDIPYSGEARHIEEMGDNLSRRFFSFEKLVSRDKLADMKLLCRKIEAGFADRVDDFIFRTVNVDPGIMTPENVVMASSRGFNYRIYITRGVFAQVELIHSKSQFVRLPWTNPDFCHDEALDFFGRVRKTFELLPESLPASAEAR
ncbi:MAG: DUF4416 family protein [candidate division Zixibacteria bacterium]